LFCVWLRLYSAVATVKARSAGVHILGEVVIDVGVVDHGLIHARHSGVVLEVVSIPSAAPVAVSVVPNSGSGASQIFEITFSHPGGYKQLSDVRLLINAEADGSHACYIYYSLSTDSFMLVNDSGEGSKSAILSGGASLENSQCRVLTKGAAVKGDGADISVTIPVHFKSQFAGTKKLILYAETSGGARTDLLQKGSYEATN